MGAVLVIDGDDDVRDLVALKLRMEGHVVETADSIETGWNCAICRHQDLFVIDWTQLGENGSELCGRLRTLPQYVDTPIIVLMARAGEDAQDAALAIGATDYFSKPFSPRELAIRAAQLMIV